MGRADHIWQSYAQRMGINPASSGARDAQQQYGIHLLRDITNRLEVILEDEGVDERTAERVIRCLLYGAPSDADAIERVRVSDETARLIETLPKMREDRR